jgi:hypothetical protein
MAESALIGGIPWKFQSANWWMGTRLTVELCAGPLRAVDSLKTAECRESGPKIADCPGVVAGRGELRLCTEHIGLLLRMELQEDHWELQVTDRVSGSKLYEAFCNQADRGRELLGDYLRSQLV